MIMISSLGFSQDIFNDKYQISNDEARILNEIFKNNKVEFDFTNKKIAFIEGLRGENIVNKSEYFESYLIPAYKNTTKNRTHFILLKLTDKEKKETNGIDAFIIYPPKIFKGKDYLIKKLSNLNKIEQIKQKVNQNWKRENPKFQKSDKSFFNNQNSRFLFVIPVQVSGRSKIFSWDYSLSLIDYLCKRDCENITIKDTNEKTEIVWNKPIKSMVCINDKKINTAVESWVLLKYNECPGTISFPIVYYNYELNIKNPITNNIEGIAFIGEKLKINSLNKVETSLFTTENKEIKGIGYDLNNDDLIDIFYFKEEIDDSRYYGRLYLNIDGEWKCEWIEYFETCI